MQSVVKYRLDPRALLGRGARPFRKCVFRASVLPTVVLGITPANAGALAKIAPDLQILTGEQPDRTLRVIVRRTKPLDREFQEWLAGIDGVVRCDLDRLGMLVIDIPAGKIAELAGNASILSLSPDRAVGASPTTAAADRGGAGVTAAVLDSGIAPHPDLTTPPNRLFGWMDLVQG